MPTGCCLLPCMTVCWPTRNWQSWRAAPIFTESIFPKAFDTAAQDSYLEAQDTFSSLFEDTSKYKAIMSALAEWLYGEFRKK